MNDNFVTYKKALRLKELGFDAPCLAIIYPDDQLMTGSSEFVDIMLRKDNQCIKAPLWQQAIDFFRDEFNIHIYFTPRYSLNLYKENGNGITGYNGTIFDFQEGEMRNEYHSIEEAKRYCLNLAMRKAESILNNKNNIINNK